MQQRVDTQAYSRTPEGVDMGLRICGLVPRMGASVIDIGTLLVGCLLIALLASSLFGRAAQGFMLIGWFLFMWLFPTFCEMRWGGTIGKKVCSLRVIHDDGTPVVFSTSMARNLLKFMDSVALVVLLPQGIFSSYGDGSSGIWMLALFYMQPSSVLCILFHPLHKRPGDMVAGTLVVRNDKMEPPLFRGDFEPAEPPLPLTTTEQQAIIDFATRAHTLSHARQAELANILEGLTGLEGPPAVDVLHAYARAFAGVKSTKTPPSDEPPADIFRKDTPFGGVP